jgi:hypothetical protein
MTIHFQKLEFLKFYKGNQSLYCQVDAQHAEAPKADRYTGQLVENLVEETQCAGIISTVSRTVADLNRIPNEKNKEAIYQYRGVIKKLLQYRNLIDENNNTLLKPYLHLTIHGMKDVHYGPLAIEVGTLKGLSCSNEVLSWFKRTISLLAKEVLPNLVIVFDQVFIGNKSILFHRFGDGRPYSGYGSLFNTFQLEFSYTLRRNYLPQIIELLSSLMWLFQKEIVLRKR